MIRMILGRFASLPLALLRLALAQPVIDSAAEPSPAALAFFTKFRLERVFMFMYPRELFIISPKHITDGGGLKHPLAKC